VEEETKKEERNGGGNNNTDDDDDDDDDNYHWVQHILKTQLNLKNKITAINTLAVQVLVYSSGIVN